MNLLRDTHIAIWAVSDDPRLSTKARALILDPASQLSVSTVSLWEIAIKFALQRGADPMPISAAKAFGYFQASGFAMAPVTPAHVLALEGLPRIHEDPFDRLLAATAMTEPCGFVTHDAVLKGYGSFVIIV